MICDDHHKKIKLNPILSSFLNEPPLNLSLCWCLCKASLVLVYLLPHKQECSSTLLCWRQSADCEHRPEAFPPEVSSGNYDCRNSEPDPFIFPQLPAWCHPRSPFQSPPQRPPQWEEDTVCITNIHLGQIVSLIFKTHSKHQNTSYMSQDKLCQTHITGTNLHSQMLNFCH